MQRASAPTVAMFACRHAACRGASSTKVARDAPRDSASRPTDPDPAVVAELREIVLPIDDRYAEAVAYLAAADLLETDNSDTVNAQTADRYRALGRELASK